MKLKTKEQPTVDNLQENYERTLFVYNLELILKSMVFLSPVSSVVVHTAIFDDSWVVEGFIRPWNHTISAISERAITAITMYN